MNDNIFFEKYINYLIKEKRYSKNTVIAYSNDLKEFEDFLLKEINSNLNQIGSVNKNTIRKYVVYLNNNFKITTSSRKITCIKSYIKFLFNNNYINNNIFDKIILPSNKQLELPIFVNEDKMNLILDKQLSKENNFKELRDSLIIDILFNTGIRREELINIRENDISNKEIKIFGKGNKERIIPISDNIIEKIEKYKKLKRKLNCEHKILLVTDKGKVMYPNFVYRKVKEVLIQNTNLAKNSPHILRHSYATILLNNGMKINSLKELLGHSSIATTQKYTHNDIETLKKEYAKYHNR